MTDNRALLFGNGDEAVFINRSDGLAIDRIKALNLDQIIISSEKNSIVKKRAEKLGIMAFNSAKDKDKVLLKYIEGKNISINECAFIGNDLNDLPLMRRSGYSVAPVDAHSKIKEVADLVLKERGGEGMVRVFIERLLSIDQLTDEELDELISNC